MSSYDSYGSVFRSPSYWVALLTGVGAIALAVRHESARGSLSSRISSWSCRECGGPMEINARGVSNHVSDDGEIDYDVDADHVAIADESL